MDNQPFLLACNHIPNLGPRKLFKLLAHWPNLEDLFSATPISLEQTGIPKPLAHAISHFDWKKVEADLHWAQKPGNYLLTLEDEAYPTLLKEIYDPPMVLYLQGNPRILENKSIALVGSRKPSATGRETAYQFAKALAYSDLNLVSGLALGIDAAIHQGCLDAKGATIAVMGTGIDRIYPLQHRKLAEKIREKGLLITEFPLKTPPTSGHFPQRNRIISGLSLITVVVEATIKSGSLITARLALEQNRDVFAVPGSIYNPQSRGCHYLLQQGARLVSSAEEILLESGLKKKTARDSKTLKQESRHNELIQYIGFETTTIDTLCQRSGLTIENIACLLAELEIQGLITSVPGGYMRCSE